MIWFDETMGAQVKTSTKFQLIISKRGMQRFSQNSIPTAGQTCYAQWHAMGKFLDQRVGYSGWKLKHMWLFWLSSEFWHVTATPPTRHSVVVKTFASVYLNNDFRSLWTIDINEYIPLIIQAVWWNRKKIISRVVQIWDIEKICNITS